MDQMARGEKIIRVRKLTKRIDGRKVKAGAIKQPKVTGALKSVGLSSGKPFAKVLALSDALRTPLQSGAVALGWHVIHERDMWWAIGPIFADLLVSPAGWGPTPEQARAALAIQHERNDSAVVPSLPEFRVWD